MPKYQSARLDEVLDQSPKPTPEERPDILIRARGEVTVDSDTNEAVISFEEEGGWAELKQDHQGQWEMTIFKGSPDSGSVFLGKQILGDPDSEVHRHAAFWKRDHEETVAELAKELGLPYVTPEQEDEDDQERLVKEFREHYRQLESFARLQIIYSYLVQQAPFLTLISAGGMLPFQAEGFLHGFPFYFRYRHGRARLSVGGNLFTAPLYQSGATIGGEFDGALDDEKFQEVFLFLLERLERAPFLWSFHGKKENGALTERLGWGHTQEEGWQDMVANLTEHMRRYQPEEDPKEFLKSLNLSPTSPTVDDREFPEEDPDFRPLAQR